MTLTSSMVIAFSRPVFLVRFVIPWAIKTNSTPLIDESSRIPTACRSALVILFRMTLAGLAALLGLYGRDIHCTGKADDSDELFSLVHFYGHESTHNKYTQQKTSHIALIVGSR